MRNTVSIFVSILLSRDLLFSSMVVFNVSIMSIFIFLLLSSSIYRNVSLLDLLLSYIILVTFAYSVLLFSTRRVKIVSSLLVVAGFNV